MPSGSGTSPSSFLLKRFTIMPKTPVIGAGWIRACAGHVVLLMFGGYDIQTPATGAV